MTNAVINADDGVSSGTSGLKTQGGDDGILKIQTNGVDAISVSGSQVVTFANAPVGIPAPASLSTASGSAPSYSARAWVNFNGTGTVAIRASGNVTSITDNNVGLYTVNFTTAMPDADYSCVASCLDDSAQSGGTVGVNTDSFATSSVRIVLSGSAVGAQDQSVVSVAIFR
jgi:hypothetical protein